MSQLRKAFNRWRHKGLFKTLGILYPSDLPWARDYGTTLDTKYFGGRSGQKETSPLIDSFLEDSRAASLTDEQIEEICEILYAIYGEKWKKLYNVLSLEYNPIQNYDMTEVDTPNLTKTETPNITKTETPNLTRTETPNITNTETPNLTRTETPNVTRTETPNITRGKDTGTNTDYTVDTEQAVENSVYGFNSTSPVPSTDGNGNNSVRTHGSSADNTVHETETETGTRTESETGTRTETQTGSRTVSETGTRTIADTGTKTETETGTRTEKETGTRTLTRKGNIGVTTSQQMIESEIALWDWNFFNTVFIDVDNELTVSVYSCYPANTDPKLIGKTIVANGTYYAVEDDADGFRYVVVNVEAHPTLIEKTITENGVYTASDYNADGFSKVTVNVPEAPVYWTPGGTPYLEEMTIPQTFIGIVFTSFQSATFLKRFSVFAPNITNFQQYRLDGSMPNLEYVYLPYINTANTYGASAVSLYGRPEGESAEIQLGSVGHPVTAMDSQAFGGGGSSNPNKGQRWTATIYVNASTLADIPSAVKDTAPWGANYLSNIIYRSSTTGEVITE